MLDVDVGDFVLVVFLKRFYVYLEWIQPGM